MRGSLRKRIRKMEADTRQRLRDERSDATQPAKLEREGHGHCREAERLRAKLEEKEK